MQKVCRTIPWDTRMRVGSMLLVGAAIVSVPAVLAQAQSSAPLPSAPSANTQTAPATQPDPASQPDPGTPAGAEPTGQAGSRSGSSVRPRPGQAGPFGLPRSISHTTASGVKFQLALPRLSMAGGGHSEGNQISPLDSGGAQPFAGGGGSAMFPPAGGGVHTDGVGAGAGAGMGGGSHGGGGQAGGLSMTMPGDSSIFKVDLSMKGVVGGSFGGSSSGGGGAGGPTPGAGAGAFGLSGGGDGGASEFGGVGGGARGGRGSGAKMSLGLRF